MRIEIPGVSNVYAGIFEAVRPRWGRVLAPRLKEFARLAAWLDGQLKDRYFPPNLANCQASASDIWGAVHDDGLPLVWIPRTELIEQLLTCGSFQERVAVLVSATQEVLNDCQHILEEVSAPHLQEYKIAAQEAIDALNSEHFRSAQALAANILEGSLNGLWDGDDRRVLRRKGRKVKGGSLEFATFEDALESVTDDPDTADLSRVLLHFAAVWHAYDYHDDDQSDLTPAPVRFNRHATAHGIGPSKYTHGTALVAVMLVSSHLRTMQDLTEESE